MITLNPKWESRLAVFFIITAVLLRFLPHPWNMTPLTALALFSGAHLETRKGLLFLLVALVLSDWALGWHGVIPFTWGCFVLIFFMSRWLSLSRHPRMALAGSLMGSTVFFVVTNLAVFLFTPLYPRSWEGLVQCYTLAVPFFRNQVLGDLVYTALLFGLYQLALFKPLPAKVR